MHGVCASVFVNAVWMYLSIMCSLYLYEIKKKKKKIQPRDLLYDIK